MAEQEMYSAIAKIVQMGGFGILAPAAVLGIGALVVGVIVRAINKPKH